MENLDNYDYLSLILVLIGLSIFSFGFNAQNLKQASTGAGIIFFGSLTSIFKNLITKNL